MDETALEVYVKYISFRSFFCALEKSIAELHVDKRAMYILAFYQHRTYIVCDAQECVYRADRNAGRDFKSSTVTLYELSSPACLSLSS